MIQAPPPWTLHATGIVLLYRFPRAFVEAHGRIPPFLEGRFCGGIGAVMLVEYQHSPVGPYHEALFIPGMFEVSGQRLFSITSIYVSTMESVVNGQRNWGIPKQLADFSITTEGRITHFHMSLHGASALDVRVRSRGPRLPINTRWFPLRPALIQEEGSHLLKTAPYGSGKISLARLEHTHVENGIFPDFSAHKPLVAFHTMKTRLLFPSATEHPAAI